MLELKNATLRRGTQSLFEKANLVIYPGQRVGITGVNGCGKSSLFALILKQLELDTGNINFPEKWTISHVEQEIRNLDFSALDYVLSGDEELFSVLKKLEKNHPDLSNSEITSLNQSMDQLDGYTAKSKASKLLAGLGFKQIEFENAVATFSGGWQMRLNLARALMCRSDLLLLDEPTNHLDLETVFWLEDYLNHYSGTLLIISHDRNFLDNIINNTIHITEHKAIMYKGNFSNYEKQRAAQLALQQAGYDKQQKQIKHIQSFITRFKAKATKAKQAQSRIKSLQKLELIAPAHINSTFHFEFSPPDHKPHTLIKMSDLNLGYNNLCILEDISLDLFINDRIGILGANGEGKSTLIKFIAGELKNLAGTCDRHKHVKISYFAQHQIEQLDLNDTPISHMTRINTLDSEQNLRDFLGRFNFKNEKIKQTINTLSGGEKARLVLACLVYDKPNLLLLDEPTNHLDMDMRDALTLALQSYEGAMILVSHDRHLLDTVCDSFLLVKNRQVLPYDGALDDYRSLLNKESSTPKVLDKPEISRKEQKRIDAERRKLLQPINNKLKKLEESLAKFNIEKLNIEEQLADSQLYEAQNKETLKNLLEQQTELLKTISATEDECFVLMEQIESTEKNT